VRRMSNAAVMSLLLCLCMHLWGCDRQSPSGKAPEMQAEGQWLRITYATAPRIVLEAEDGVVTPPMDVFEDSDCGGGKYVLAPEGPNHEEISVGGDVTHRIQVDEAGEYMLWLRVRFSGACGNSLGLFLDGERLGTVEDALFERWHWLPLRGRRLPLSAGEHRLVIANREDGAACDQVLLTTDPDYRPAGIETASVAPAAGSDR